ncbi:MAG: hypothetical protein ACRD3T_20190, partial [Terriglobia bacterium]
AEKLLKTKDRPSKKSKNEPENSTLSGKSFASNLMKIKDGMIASKKRTGTNRTSSHSTPDFIERAECHGPFAAAAASLTPGLKSLCSRNEKLRTGGVGRDTFTLKRLGAITKRCHLGGAGTIRHRIRCSS